MAMPVLGIFWAKKIRVYTEDKACRNFADIGKLAPYFWHFRKK
jgi:hypothetical protein